MKLNLNSQCKIWSCCLYMPPHFTINGAPFTLPSFPPAPPLPSFNLSPLSPPLPFRQLLNNRHQINVSQHTPNSPMFIITTKNLDDLNFCGVYQGDGWTVLSGDLKGGGCFINITLMSSVSYLTGLFKDIFNTIAQPCLPTLLWLLQPSNPDALGGNR